LNELKNTPAGLDCQLSKTVRFGIAFHHAGMKNSSVKSIKINFNWKNLKKQKK
jgi:replicative superfamily II helicase